MFSIFMFSSLGLLVTFAGFHYYLKPDSNFIRTMLRVPFDVDQDDLDLSIIKFRGLVGIAAGLIIILMVVWRIIVYMG